MDISDRNTRPARAWFSALATAVCVLMVVAGAFVAAGATDRSGIQVARDPSAANVSPAMRAALRRDLRLTDDQVTARLVAQDWAARLRPALSKRLGAAYAGSWMADDGETFVVAITDERLARVVRASGATPRLVAHSEAELAAVNDRLAAHGKALARMPDALVGWTLDPARNEVRVQHLPGRRAVAEAFVAASGLARSEVAYEAVGARAEPDIDVEGGSEYFTGTPNGVTAACSAGFAVTWRNPFIQNPPPVQGYVTAGHCSNLATYVRQPTGDLAFQGAFVLALYENNHDEAVVATADAYRPVPRVKGYGQPDLNVLGKTPQPDNSAACKSGRTTGLTCGRIRAGTFTMTIAGRSFGNLKATDACSLGGDSGGAVMAANHAQGIHVASIEFLGGLPPGATHAIICNPNVGARFSFYLPIDHVLSSLNASLKTVKVTPPSVPKKPSTKWTEGTKFWDGDVGGSALGQVASVSLGPDKVQAFARGTDSGLYTNVQTDGVWGEQWQQLATGLTHPPTVVARDGGIDVYYRGSDTRAYYRRWNGNAWEPVVQLGGVDVQGRISAVVYQNNWVILFVRGSDDEIKYNFFDGQQQRWSGWLGLGGDTNDSPTAIMRPNANGQPVLEVYARWADDNVRYRRLDPAGPPGWQPWTNLGGVWKATPVPVTVGKDDSFLLGWARDDTLHFQRFRNGDWRRGPDGGINTGWRGIGGQLAASPTAVAGPGNQIRVFARDANRRVNMAAWTGNDIYWENWVPLDGDTAESLGASRRGDTGTVDVFGVDAETQQIYQTTVDVVDPRPTLAISDATPQVGEAAAFTVTGPPGAEISWSSARDGTVVEDHVSTGQRLDSDGTLSWYPGQLPGSAVGSWVRQAHVTTQAGTSTTQVAYAVTGHPVGVYVDASQYEVGQEVTFLVTGPPNTAIHWSSTVNGQPSGETDAFYNQYTDSNGIFTSTAPWTDPRTGAWIKRVTVAGQTSEVGFEVAGPPPPPPPPPPVKLDKTSAATGSDGRTYLFALRADNRVVTREQQGGGWSDWYPVGDRTATIPPTASVNSQGRVEVYAVGTDNAVYRSVSNGAGPGGWSGWNTVGQCCIVSRVSVVQDRFGRMNVFGRGTDNAIYFSRESTPGSGAWTGWQSLGPHIISAPAAVRNSDGWIRVFGVSGDNNVWVKDLVDIAPDNRQISGWTGMGGGPVVGDPAVAGPIVTVFVRRPDNLIYATHSQGAAWRPWISVGGGALVSDPVAISHPNGASPTVFALGTDQQVYASRLTCFGGGWACFETTYSGWQAIGSGPFAVPPALTALPDGRFQALGLAPDRRAFANSQVAVQTVNFTGWSPL